MSWLSSHLKNKSTLAFLAFSGFFWACLIFIFAPALPVGMGLPVPDYTNLYNEWSWVELFEGLCGEKTLFLSPLFPLGLIASTQWGMELLWLVTAFCGGLSMAFFLRTRGVSYWAAYGGGLLFGFIGYMFTLFSAGHSTNAMTWAFVALPFAFLNRCLERQRLLDFALLGASVAWCMPQSDVWLLFMYLLATYGLWRTFCFWRSSGKIDFLWKLYPKFLISVVVLLLIGGAHIKNEFHVALAGREQQFSEASTRQSGQNTASDPKIEAQKKQERWIFSTNWSLPPEDVLEFIVPGIYGDTSFQPPYPYWGRLGQPADFQKGRMMPNYRQHSVYMGSLTVLLALLSLFGWQLVKRQNRSSPTPNKDVPVFEDVPFFGIAFLLIVIIAMGRYTPLYQVVYHTLPFMKTMRCPVKFLHVAELCLATLAGFGLEALIRNPLQKARTFAWRIAAGFVIGLVILWLVFTSSSAAWTQYINALAFFGNAGATLVSYSLSNIGWALARMFVICGLLFWLARQKTDVLATTLSKIVMALLIAFGTLDLAVADKRYVTPIDLSAHYASNSLVALLKAKTQNKPANIMNYVTSGNEREDWLSASLRIHGYFNMAPTEQDVQPRALYEKYRSDPLKFWEIKGVRFLLIPRKNIQPLANQGLIVIHGDFLLQNQSIRACPPQENSIVLAEIRAYAPLPALYSQWRSVPAEEQANALQNGYISGMPLVTFTNVSTHTASIPPRPVVFDTMRRQIDVWTTRGTVANVATPSLLVFNELYNNRLVATVNGASIPVGQANGQWAAILVPAGGGVVTLSHCGPSWLIVTSACATFAVLVCFWWSFLKKTFNCTCHKKSHLLILVESYYQECLAKFQSEGFFNLLKAIYRFLLPQHLENWPEYIPYFQSKIGLEIGGPSSIFGRRGHLVIYPLAARIDNCNFEIQTVWEGAIRKGFTFIFDSQKKPGYQYISEASNLQGIYDTSYDFVLSSHCIEHLANPLKGLTEWARVLKQDGLLVLVVPHKDGTFDHRRTTTSMDHVLLDFNNHTNENDLTHLEEILQLHDLSKDPSAGDFHAFQERCTRNFENRCIHHHVFDTRLAVAMVNYVGLQILSVAVFRPRHVIILAKKIGKNLTCDNTRFLGIDIAPCWSSPFPSDRRFTSQ